MAKQIEFMKFSGTLGGVNFYILNGKGFVRQAGGGFTREAIKKSPNMVRVRENNSEFATTSAVKKIFKDSLRLFFGSQKDVKLHRRMMSLFMQIKDCDDVSERGKRSVAIGLQTEEGKKLLTRFEFTPFTPDFSKGVYDADTFTYSITDFYPQELTYPNGATHLEIQLGVVVLDFDTQSAKLFASDPTLLLKTEPQNNFSLTLMNVPIGTGVRIPVLHYRYTQELNGELYELKDKMVYGLKVLEVGDGF